MYIDVAGYKAYIGDVRGGRGTVIFADAFTVAELFKLHSSVSAALPGSCIETHLIWPDKTYCSCIKEVELSVLESFKKWR